MSHSGRGVVYWYVMKKKRIEGSARCSTERGEGSGDNFRIFQGEKARRPVQKVKRERKEIWASEIEGANLPRII